MRVSFVIRENFMKTFFVTCRLLVVIPIFVITSFAQTDETRQATGLPMMIGGNSSTTGNVPLSGKLTIPGLDTSQSKPTIYVSVFAGGALIDRRLANDAGYYYMPSVPRDGGFLVVEIDGAEVARTMLTPVVGGSMRQDLVINWMQAQNAKAKSGIISAKDYYERTGENSKLFEKAVLASKDKNPDNAVKLFRELVKNDPKDFVAWTELGTLLYKAEKFAEAEEAYNKALEQKPDFIVALMNLGKLHLAQKQADKSIIVLSKAVEVAPASADAQHYLGEAYLQAKKGSKAVIHLNEAIRLAPIEKAEIHLRLATLYNAAGVKDRAVNEYKLFLEKVPNHPDKEKIEKYIKENSTK
jgi:Flp pilus assembly protein TadD